jgi:recombination protein RecR
VSIGSGRLEALDRLVDAFGRLPGVGAKSAERLAHHILKCSPEEALALADAIREVKDRVHHCQICFHLTESTEAHCFICRDSTRDASIVCVVEQSRDLLALERAGSYRGVYHVLLGRLAPLQGTGPDQLTIDRLEERVREGKIREVIMATNPTLEGDGTALLVATRLASFNVPITRLARGLASGSVLEFANKEMLADAFAGRSKF